MLNLVHRSLAVFIVIFVVLHLANHLSAVFGVATHIAFMEFIRPIYRNIFVEIALISALFVQLFLGLYFVYRSRGKRVGFYARAQALSGCYLVFFLVAHVSAVMNGRYVLDLDTNFNFAAAGMHVGYLVFWFVPYYFLAVFSIFMHLACALQWVMSQHDRFIGFANVSAGVLMSVGALTASLIVMSLGGCFYNVDIPAVYDVMFAL